VDARRDAVRGDPPRLVLRFAVWTGIGLALAAAAILLVVRHLDTVQAERAATAHARVLARTVLREELARSDFEAPSRARRDELDRLFAGRILEEGFLVASLLRPDGTVSYSTDHRLIGRRIDSPEHVAEARRGIVRGDVADVASGGETRKSLRTYAPVAVRGGATGVVVVHQDYEPIARAANATFLPVAGIFEAVLVLLFVALVPMLRRVSVRIRRQVTEIERRAHYDELTGLANRSLFRARVGETGDGAAVLLLDLDHFKEVNDALGHDLGDELLRAVGDRLQALCDGETVARLGGDEFALLVPHSSSEAAAALAARIHETLDRPFEIGGVPLEIGASVGIAVAGEHGDGAEALLRHADVAMYAAKTAQSGTAVYDPAEDTNDAERLALAGELRRAIEEQQLTVYYQPKAELATGEIVGVEALVRWIHPERGFIPPDAFVSLAERTGLVKPLSRFVVRSAVEQCAAWAAEGLDLHVAVNLTIPDLLDLDLPDRIASLLAETGVPASKLELEVTESTILADPFRVGHVIDRLRAQGVGFAIDDFGTGYSSLAYLKQLPVQTLKIDRSFVGDMLESGSDAAIVRSTIDLAQNLGLRIVAEGVETEATWDALRAQGCTLAQGYLISKPLPAAQLAPLLAERGAKLLAATA
jgi:diguanylate cyclase (GGDEF)-like protein